MASYTITSKSHFRHLWVLIPIGIVLPAAVYFLMSYKLGYYRQDTAFLVGSITFLFCVFPMIVLHINYYLKDRDNAFEYDSLSGQSVYHGKDLRVDFGNDDIRKLLVYKSWPLAEDRTLITPWDAYNYAVIELKDGQVLKLSSLLVYELDKVVKFENMEVKKTFYAWMS